MDENDPLASQSPDEPFEPRIVEATPVPEYDGSYVGDATPPIGAVTPGIHTSAPTEAIPVITPGVAPTTLSPAAYAPAAPMYRPVDPPPVDRNPAWPYFIAVVALLAGGLVGYLIAIAVDDDEEAAPVATVPVTSEVLVADPNTEATIADLQAQIVALTAAQDDAAGLNDQIADLETALADMTAERDTLAAEIADSEGSGTDQQADLDAANEQIAVLEDQLATAVTDLESANERVAEAETALQTAVTERDAATDAIEALGLLPNPNYENGPVTKARTDATANGWTLIELPTESATAAPGTVLDQAPPAGSNMIKGSVLYITVAEAP